MNLVEKHVKQVADRKESMEELKKIIYDDYTIEELEILALQSYINKKRRKLPSTVNQ